MDTNNFICSFYKSKIKKISILQFDIRCCHLIRDFIDEPHEINGLNHLSSSALFVQYIP